MSNRYFFNAYEHLWNDIETLIANMLVMIHHKHNTQQEWVGKTIVDNKGLDALKVKYNSTVDTISVRLWSVKA